MLENHEATSTFSNSVKAREGRKPLYFHYLFYSYQGQGTVIYSCWPELRPQPLPTLLMAAKMDPSAVECTRLAEETTCSSNGRPWWCCGLPTRCRRKSGRRLVGFHQLNGHKGSWVKVKYSDIWVVSPHHWASASPEPLPPWSWGPSVRPFSRCGPPHHLGGPALPPPHCHCHTQIWAGLGPCSTVAGAAAHWWSSSGGQPTSAAAVHSQQIRRWWTQSSQGFLRMGAQFGHWWRPGCRDWGWRQRAGMRWVCPLPGGGRTLMPSSPWSTALDQ